MQRPAPAGAFDDTHPMPTQRTTEPGIGPPGPTPGKPAAQPAPARGGTEPGIGPPGPPPKKPVAEPPGAGRRDRTDPRSVVLPDNRRITVDTSRGREQMTVGEYRKRAAQAKDWVDAQRKAHPADSPGIFDYAKHYDEAASRFGLEKNWQRATNPYTSAL